MPLSDMSSDRWWVGLKIRDSRFRRVGTSEDRNEPNRTGERGEEKQEEVKYTSVKNSKTSELQRRGDKQVMREKGGMRGSARQKLALSWKPVSYTRRAVRDAHTK